LGDSINNRYAIVAVGDAKTRRPDHFSVAISVVQKQIVLAGTKPALLIYHKVSFSRKVTFVCSLFTPLLIKPRPRNSWNGCGTAGLILGGYITSVCVILIFYM
jgi:hypothetical protein